MSVVSERSFLVPYVVGIADEKEHIFTLSASLAAFGQSARQAIDEAAAYGDAHTADLFTDLARHRSSALVRGVAPDPELIGVVDDANKTALFDDGWMTLERQWRQNRERPSRIANRMWSQ